MSTPTQREEDLFDEARRIHNPEERRRFLAQTCADDAALLRRVEKLLAATEEAERFFQEGSVALGQAVLPPSISVDLGPDTQDAELGQDEALSSRIGRYRLLQKLGEGGCGVVYMAEQEEPVRRRVALKVIKLGMETKSVIERFEMERQALAMMDHPNIARVFDAGATARGRPYFVMEWVRGVKITEFCDRHRLSTRERLDLFVRVCHAIQHAHQKGIIHGDIKPSNILVALHDGVPVPKVIDFGISKATEARLTDRELFTAYAQLIGTPAYMSPEQAEMSGLDIDTRSDIYSLGVVLYELLTGNTPFDGKALLKSGLDEMRRILRETEPPRPSLRLQTMSKDVLLAIAEARHSEANALLDLLEGDLDWIVMKALEKDRGRRYETANGLAKDVQRQLNNEPVSARPPSRVYRFRKLVRRNRVMFAAGGAVAAALVAGTSTSTYLFLKEREARHRAVAAEQQQARLRHEAEIREQVTQAALLVSQERFEEADALLNGLALTDPTLEGAAVFRSDGEWHAVQGRWKQAADRFEHLLRINQLDGIDVCTLDVLRCGPALVQSGDGERYERFRRQAIARFGGTPTTFADRIVKIALLAPAGREVLSALEPFARAAEESLTVADVAGDGFQAAWRSVALALWEYRNGNAAKAVEWASRCVAYAEQNAPRTATAHVILAMSFQRLGRTEEARAELALGAEVVEARFGRRDDRGTPVNGFWFDRVFAEILLREARQELGAAPHETLVHRPAGARG